MSKVKGFQDEEYHLLQEKSAKQEDQKESPIAILEKNFNTSNDSTLRKLWIASGVCLIFMIIEVIGGYLANSIAIMSDAAHLLSDILGFIISIVSIYISRRGATTHMSYGYHRAEVIGALVSVTLIWGLTIWLLYEASLRIMSNNEVNGLIMLITAVIGFVFNIIMGVILAYEGIDHNLHSHHDHEGGDHGHSHGHSHAKKKEPDHGHAHDDNDHNHAHAHEDGKEHNHDHNEDEHGHSHDEEEHNHSNNQNNNNGHSDHENVNLRAALIHVIGDAIQNLGVVIAGAVIYFYPKASIADPICTFIFSIIVGFSTIRILKDCISVLMEGSPRELEINELERDLSDIKGVVEVHDLHVWSLSIGKVSLSCHLTSNNPQISLKKARKLIKDKYKISHSTIQVELDSEKSFEDCAHDLHHEVNNK